MPSNHPFNPHFPTPFGSVMLGRDFSGGKYRFGFGGYERDNEILGEGKSYTTEFRQYDPRLGRWKSIDPATQKFPGECPYLALLNNPNIYTDRNGDIPWPLFAKWKNKSGKTVSRWQGDGFRIKGREDHNGLDINMGEGSDDLGAPVVATHDGIIVQVKPFDDPGPYPAGGNTVTIQSEDGTIQTKYMHLGEFAEGLKVGQKVYERDLIGTLGSSAYRVQSGKIKPHTHYELHLKINGVFSPINPIENGSPIDPQKLLGLKSTPLEEEPSIEKMQQVDITVKKSKQLPISRLISETDSTNLPKENPANDSTQNTNNKPDEK